MPRRSCRGSAILGRSLVADNAPLDEWLAFNTLDFIYACDLGDDEAKARFAAAVNTRAPLARSGAAHYRRFFCAFTSPAHAATASRVIDAARSPDPSEPQRLVRELVTGILGWRKELRERSTREVEAIHRHVGELDAAVLRFKEAVAEKDVHIGKLDQHVSSSCKDAIGAEGRSYPEARSDLLRPFESAGRERALARRRATELEQQPSASVGGARATRGEHTAAARRARSRPTSDSAGDSPRTRLASHPDVPFVAVDGGAAAIHRDSSAPHLYHRSRRALAGVRRWVRERVTRRRNYALVVESGLFDATWYRERYPDVGNAGVDPLVHYLKWGAREGRDPHPLFASMFYLQSNRDVHAAGVNPLVHYLTAGGYEGRAPHPDFDGAFYLASNPDVAAAGLTFDVGRGEALGIVGESGCGKSTVARACLRLITADAGSVRFDGIDVATASASALRALRQRLQIVFQDPASALDPRQRIADALGESIKVHGIARSNDVTTAVLRLLDEVGLPPSAARRYPHEFSGGQRQRIGIARALALGPDLVFADEPVSALDVSVQAQILVLLDELRHRRELAFVFISHDLGVVRHFCQRVAVMYLGRIVEEGPVPAIFEEPLHPYTRLLKSSSPIPDPEQAVALDLQEGEPPSPVDPPSGCHFHPRCPFVMERCKAAAPVLEEVAPGRRVACYLFDETSRDGAGAVASPQ